MQVANGYNATAHSGISAGDASAFRQLSRGTENFTYIANGL